MAAPVERRARPAEQTLPLGNWGVICDTIGVQLNVEQDKLEANRKPKQLSSVSMQVEHLFDQIVCGVLLGSSGGH